MQRHKNHNSLLQSKRRAKPKQGGVGRNAWQFVDVVVLFCVVGFGFGFPRFQLATPSGCMRMVSRYDTVDSESRAIRNVPAVNHERQLVFRRVLTERLQFSFRCRSSRGLCKPVRLYLHLRRRKFLGISCTVPFHSGKNIWHPDVTGRLDRFSVIFSGVDC